MGVAKKHRRKIEIDGRCFLWSVKEDLGWLTNGCHLALSIISEDKHFIISYGIGQSEPYRHLISLGKEFPKLSQSTKGYQRLRCPQWEQVAIITPEIVCQVIEWCFIDDVNAIEFDWRGKRL